MSQTTSLKLVDRLRLFQKMIDLSGPNVTPIGDAIEAIESMYRVCMFLAAWDKGCDRVGGDEMEAFDALCEISLSVHDVLKKVEG